MSDKENILPFDSNSPKREESRDDKILRLQKLIDQGAYRIDSDELSQSILDSEKSGKGPSLKKNKKR